jgi:hypothetical protein
MPSDFPAGFRSLATEGQLSPQTIQVICRIAGRRNWGVWPSSFNEHDVRLCGDPWMSPPHRDFREACPALNLANGPNGPPLEKLICLAMIRYCLNRAVYDRPRACIYHTLSIDLLQVLPNVIPSIGQAEREAMLWVFLIGVDCWAVASERLTDEAAFLLRQIELKFPETLGWTGQDFDGFGTKFLWTTNISRIMDIHAAGRSSSNAASCN